MENTRTVKGRRTTEFKFTGHNEVLRGLTIPKAYSFPIAHDLAAFCILLIKKDEHLANLSRPAKSPKF